jgi:lia operon protein LiaG
MRVAPRPPTSALLSIALAALAFSSTSAQTERRTLSGDRVSIYNLAGRLRVQAGGGANVVVEVTRSGRDANQLALRAGDIRGVATLRVIYPADRIVYPELSSRSNTELRVNEDGTFDDHGGWTGSWREADRVQIHGSGSGLEAHADMVVSVPRGQRLSVHWGAGEALVSNVDGDLSISVAAARITTEHTRGALNLDAGSGSVSVLDAQGEVNLDSGSGSVSVDGVRGNDLSMDSGSGTMTVTNVDVKTLKADVGSGGMRLGRVKASVVRVDVGSGGVDVDMASPVEELVVDGGSGGVTVRLPATQGAEVDIETGSGGIDSDFAVQTTRFGRNHLRGQIGNGRGRIRIESGSGRVRLIKNG